MKTQYVLDGRFLVSDEGNVWRIKNGKQTEAKICYVSRDNKYGTISYYENGKQIHVYVHRLIASSFIPNPKNLPQVNHIDGNTKNNRVDNLEWCNAKHNIQHAYRNGLINHHREKRICACCGKEISDSNKSGLCKNCKTLERESKRLDSNLLFLGIVEFHKTINHMTNLDISLLTGYKKDTIDKFMAGKRLSPNVANKICQLFDINNEVFR